MGSCTNAALLLAVGCTDHLEVQPPPVLGISTSDTGIPETGRPTETGGTGDTGPPTSVPPLGDLIRLFPEDPGDWAGRDLDVADLDGDGEAEVLVNGTFAASPSYGYIQDPSAAYLLRAPFQSGTLRDEAAAVWEASGWVSGFANAPLILPSTRQVGLAGKLLQVDTCFNLFDVPERLPAEPFTSDDHVAYIDNHLHVDLGVGGFSARCETASGPALCLSGTNYVDISDFSGHVLVYELPIDGARSVLDYETWLHGDIADDARNITGDDDLDGDGRADLVVGAFRSMGTGRLAILYDLPPGDHRVWDVADATLTGEATGEEFGLGLATGDLNGDGYGDVLSGSPLGDGGGFAFLGPLAGDRTASQADVSVSGGDVGEWLGYALAVGDLTADGGGDLAVGAPWSFYIEDAPPGSVFVFDDPSGALDMTEATWRLTSGVDASDAFGISIKQGDLDGDGFVDLVIGAPRDPTVGLDAGSVTIISGAAL